MATKLNRLIRREGAPLETSGPDRDRPIIITLYPGQTFGLRFKGRRKELSIPVLWKMHRMPRPSAVKRLRQLGPGRIEIEFDPEAPAGTVGKDLTTYLAARKALEMLSCLRLAQRAEGDRIMATRKAARKARRDGRGGR